MSAKYSVQQRGPGIFVIVDSNKRIVHWTSSRRRATKVIKQLRSKSK